MGLRCRQTCDPLLRRSACAAGQPARAQVSRCLGLSGSDREYPALTGRSGTQRARRLSLLRRLAPRRSGPRWLLVASRRGSQKGFPEGVPRRGSQKGFPEGVPRRGSQKGFPEGVPRRGSQKGFPEGVPRRGSQKGFPEGVPRRGSQKGFPEGRLDSSQAAIVVKVILQETLKDSGVADPHWMRGRRHTGAGRTAVTGCDVGTTPVRAANHRRG